VQAEAYFEYFLIEKMTQSKLKQKVNKTKKTKAYWAEMNRTQKEGRLHMPGQIPIIPN